MKKKEIYATIEKAVRDAQNDVQTRIVVKELSDLKNQLDKLNNNRSAAGFLLDLAITAILGPVSGHITVALANKFVGTMIKNRMRDVEIIRATWRSRNLITTFEKYRKDSGFMIRNIDTALSDDLSKALPVVLKIPLEELKRETQSIYRKTHLAVTAKEFVDDYSPVVCDIVQALVPPIAQKFLGSPEETKAALNSIYNEMKPDIFTTLSNVRIQSTKYARMQTNVDDMFKKIFLFFTDAVLDEDVLDKLVTFFSAETELINESLSNINIDQQYLEYFKIICWIFYLGDPNAWLTGNHKFESIDRNSIDRKKYSIENLGPHLGTKISVLGVPEDSITMDTNKVKRGLYVAKIDCNVPRDLLIIFTTDLHHNFGNETFLERAIRTKQKGLGKPRGFGIEAAQPISKSQREREEIDPLYFAVNGGASEYLAAEDLAIYMVVEWCIKVDQELNRNNGIIDVLRFQKKYTGKLDKTFSLSNVTW